MSVVHKSSMVKNILSNEELQTLAHKLTDYFPSSYAVYCEVQAVLQCKWTSTTCRAFHVNRWPDFTTVVVTPLDDKTTGEQDLPRLSMKYNWMVFYVEGHLEDAQYMVEPATGVLDYHMTKPLTLFVVPDDLMPEINKHMTRHGRCDLNIYCTVMAADSSSIQDFGQLPEGYKLTNLKPEDANMVLSQWKFSRFANEDYIAHLIKAGRSSAILTNKGQYAGYMLQHHYGFMGMLEVLPEFRGQGLSKILVCDLAKKLLGQGHIPVVTIEKDHDISLKVHTACGFYFLPDCTFSKYSSNKAV